MLSCDGGLKADENWMSAETSWGSKSVQGFEGQCGKFKPYTPFNHPHGSNSRQLQAKGRGW